MSENRSPIPSRLYNAAKGGHVAGTADIIDDDKGKTQDVINEETDEKITTEVGRAEQAESTLDGKIATEKTRAEGVEGGLNTRLQTVEQLAEISVGGGDIQIANTGEDIQPGSGKVATANALSDAYGYYEENPEFVDVKTDSENKLLEGTKTDGTKIIGGDLKVGGTIYSTGLDARFAQKVDKEEDKSLIDAEYASAKSTINSPEFLDVTLDAEDKILEGITAEGKKRVNIPIDTPSVSIEHLKNPEWLSVTTDNDDKILGGRKQDGTLVENVGIETNNIEADTINTITNTAEVVEVKDHLALSSDAKEQLKNDLNINDLEKSFDVAIGNLSANGSYESELEASPIIDNASDYNIGYKSYKTMAVTPKEYNAIVGFNHDDLQPSDFIGNRKIYNKYNYNANFSFIVIPFESVEQMNIVQNGIKKISKDGNTIGLHAFFGASYWFINRHFDVRPDGTFTFAPSLLEIKGSNPDGTGYNAYGIDVTTETKLNTLYLFPANVTQNTIYNLSESNFKDATKLFTHYGTYAERTGLDLNNNIVTKKYTEWLEYWYNELIDNTLGYSSSSNIISEKFAEDYDIPSGASILDYYPDSDHLKSGKMVFFDDTNNPNYNNAEYQKVGRFKKGLFKGCASCCNYEVIDRCFDIALAFVHHYFGLNILLQYNIHGGKYFLGVSKSNNIDYFDTSHYFLLSDRQKLYLSRTKCFASPVDIMKSKGIVANYEHHHNLVIQELLYKGCKGKLPDFNNGATALEYLNLMGIDALTPVSVADLNTFMSGVDNWTKFFYENAGKSITRNGITLNIFSTFRDFLITINSSIGTGYIPIYGVDTIYNNPAESLALELLLRYCYTNNIKVVPVAAAIEIAQRENKDICQTNYFNNPYFSQSILRAVGNVKMAIPDGWGITSCSGEPEITVDRTDNSLTISTDAQSSIITWMRVYGLPEGDYRLNMYIKGSGVNKVKVYKVLNSTNLKEIEQTLLNEYIGGNDYSEISLDFSVNPYHQNADNPSDTINQLCDGYEDNLAYISVEISCSSSSEISIKNCNIQII